MKGGAVIVVCGLIGCLLLALVACRGDHAPASPPVVDRAPVRDAGPIDAPPSVIADADAAASSMPTPSGKRATADAPRRPQKIDELRRTQGQHPDADAEERAAAEARAAEYRDQVFRVEPDPFADAGPPRSTIDGATAIRGGP